MRHSHVVITALHSWCWRSRIILMTLLQVSAASLLFSDTSTMTQRLRSTISTIVDTPETLLFQLIPFCHTLHCRSRPCREGESRHWPKKSRRRTCRKRLLKNWWGSLHKTPAKLWEEVVRSIPKTREEEMVGFWWRGWWSSFEVSVLRSRGSPLASLNLWELSHRDRHYTSLATWRYCVTLLFQQGFYSPPPS